MPATNSSKGALTYDGSNFLRQILVLSCLSGKKVRVQNIRPNHDKVGITDYEMSLIRLFDKISNGTKIEVNRTGTSFLFIPGVLLGGPITHDCHTSRGIGYYLEPMMMLAPFFKSPLKLKLNGITNCEGDISVDQLRYSPFQVLKKFLVTDEGAELVIVKRGLPPKGGGVVAFSCPVRKELRPFQWTESGLVKQVRGICFTRKVPPNLGNRIIAEAKKHLNQYLTDVYFTCDNCKGPSPGFGIAINCSTTKGTHYSADSVSCHALAAEDAAEDTPPPQAGGGRGPKSPEEVGQEAAYRLLDQIHRGGCVDSASQPLVLLFMVLGPADVSKIVMGPLTTQAKYMLIYIKDFFSKVFKIDEYKPECLDEEDEEHEKLRQTGDKKLTLSCVGTGFVNFSKGNI